MLTPISLIQRYHGRSIFNVYLLVPQIRQLLLRCYLDVEKPLHGDYSRVDVITFGVIWVAPIPRHGIQGSFLVKTLEAQALTMRSIKQNIQRPRSRRDPLRYDIR